MAGPHRKRAQCPLIRRGGSAPAAPTAKPAVVTPSDGADQSNTAPAGSVALGSEATSTLRTAAPRDGGSTTPGTVEVSVTVYVDGKPQADDLTVSFECRGEGAPAPKTELVTGDGSPVVLAENVPAGQECRVSAIFDPAHPLYQMDITDNEEWVATLPGPERTRHTIRLDVTTRVTTASVAVQLVGVTGDYSKHPFIINYSCVDPESEAEKLSGTVTVKGDGVPVTLPDKIPMTLHCSFSEDLISAQLPGHTLNPVADYEAEAVSLHHSEPIFFINNYSSEKNTFTVAVKATGPATVTSDDYVVHYSCDNGLTKTIHLKGDGVPVQAGAEFPVGTVCDLRLQEHDVANWYAARPENVRLEIANTPRPIPVVFDYEFSNKARPFKIMTHFEGLPPWAVVTPEYTVTCDNGLTWNEKVRYPNYPTRTTRSVPIGATCTVAHDTSTGQLAGFTLTSPAPERVTIPPAGDDDPVLEFTFSYVPVPGQADTGTFTVTKESTGAETKTKMFTFTYDCGPALRGTLSVLGNRSVTPSEVLVPVGATCTISEDLASARIDGYTLRAPSAQTFTLSAKGEVVNLSFTNSYTKDTDAPPPGTNPPGTNPPPPVTPPPSVTPPKGTKPTVLLPPHKMPQAATKKQSLAATGGDLTTLLTTFIGFIVTAAAVIVLRKRWR